MSSLILSRKLLKNLDFVEGDSPEVKVIRLVADNLGFKLRECEEEIGKFEAKYGMTFEEFEKAWNNGKIKNKFSHETERDYMEWEGYFDERRIWLDRIKELKSS